MLKINILIAYFILYAIGIKAQTISVYADVKAGDSTDIAVQLLSTEFKKAGIKTISISPAISFPQRGLLFIHITQAEKNKISFPGKLKSFGPEGIYIKGNEHSVIIIGNSYLALQEAVFIYLEKLGFSYLLPGETWQVIPEITSVYKPINILTQPNYEYRVIANGHGYYNSKVIQNDFQFWAKANRLGGTFDIKVGHAYDAIVQRNLAVFKEHPEYFAQPVTKGTIPGEFKFNVANKDLVNLVVKDAISRYEQQLQIAESRIMISMEPSDGTGFCETPECKSIGTPSDQVFYLSNIVAKEMQKKYPGTWVGGFAYSEHILPTKYKLEPNIFVMITNGFNRTNFSTEELLRQWGNKASKVGVYDYLSVYEWDNDMPGQVPVARLNQTKKNVRKFYDNGAKAYLGESIIGWINRGPGQYVLSKLLWDINANTDSLKSDFFEKGFENTAPAILKLYTAWENYPHRVPSDNDLADWLSLIHEAYKSAKTPIVKKRIDQVKLYLHYIVLYKQLKRNPTEENLNKALTYSFRNFENPAFATLPSMVSLANYSGFRGKGLYDNPNQTWKNDKRPYTDDELQLAFKEDLASIKKVEGIKPFFNANAFVKLSSIFNTSPSYGQTSHAMWGKTEYIISIEKKSEQNYFEISSNFSANPPVTRDVAIDIYPVKNDRESSLKDDMPVLSFKQTKKGVLEKYSLASLQSGIYKIKVNDQQKMFVIKFAAGIDYSLVVKPDDKLLTTSAAGLNTFYFFVPKGVKKFLVDKTVVLQLKSPASRIINKQNNADESFYVDVQPGEEGIWTIQMQAGSIYLEGVPPYLGDHPSTMLVPAYLKK
jgi:hypothetical protein